MPQPGEPLFLDDDIAAVLEWQREQATICPGCGLPRDETMDPAAQDAYEAHAVRCHACAAKARKADSFATQKGLDAMYLSVERRPSD